MKKHLCNLSMLSVSDLFAAQESMEEAFIEKYGNLSITPAQELAEYKQLYARGTAAYSRWQRYYLAEQQHEYDLKKKGIVPELAAQPDTEVPALDSIPKGQTAEYSLTTFKEVSLWSTLVFAFSLEPFQAVVGVDFEDPVTLAQILQLSCMTGWTIRLSLTHRAA